jgi:hypothetical protein
VSIAAVESSVACEKAFPVHAAVPAAIKSASSTGSLVQRSPMDCGFMRTVAIEKALPFSVNNKILEIFEAIVVL